MDIWIPVLSTQLESPEYEFISEFVGGKILTYKDYSEEENYCGWLIHIYFKPVEFQDRPFIADVIVRFGDRRREITSNLVKNNTFLGHVRSKQKKGRLLIAARIRKTLCELDLSKPSSSRQFIIQNFDHRMDDSVLYYVNMAKLDMIGGALFKKWKTSSDSNILTVIENFENEQLQILMEATAKYDDLVIIRHSIDRLISVARKYRMHKLMRAVEDYLCETKLLNWDQKILLALQYRMSPLYVQVQRKYLLSPWTILCRVQRLLISNQYKTESINPYEMLHKHMLELIMLTEDNICIG